MKIPKNQRSKMTEAGDFKTSFIYFIFLLKQKIQIWPKLVVYKVGMQCTNVKFTFTAHNICEMIQKYKVVPIKVTSMYVMRFFSLQ